MERNKKSNTEVLDEVQALSSVGGDREFLAEIFGLTSAAWPSLLADIREGMASGDLSSVLKAARLAKAAARYVAAKRAYESALHLEEVTALGNLPAVRMASVHLEHEVEILQTVLPSFIEAECAV
jgi:hypothetical protein